MEGDRREYEDVEKEGKRAEQERKYEPDIKKVSVIHNTARKRNPPHQKKRMKHVRNSC